MMTERLMPPKLDLGEYVQTSMRNPMVRYEEHLEGHSDFPNPKGLRTIMGFPVPEWQRDLVWTRAQSIRFLESVWKGIPIGTFSFYQNHAEPELDGLLIDGQQRLHAIQQYLEDEFPVFGYRWSELTVVDQREFKTRHFPSYTVKDGGEQELRDYYNLLNFGGTAHTEDQRA